MAPDWTREQLEKGIVGRMRAVTIPVDQRFDGRQRVLDLGEMERLLRGAGAIARMECECRRMMGNCERTREGCICLDEEARTAVERYGAQPISVEEALELLASSHEAGLVHLAYTFTGREKPEVICSCCRCCCHSLSAALRFGYRDHVFSSTSIAVQDEDRCDGCGVCLERCHFQARRLEEDGLHYDPSRCYGCGLCLSSCPQEAITLAPRQG